MRATAGVVLAVLFATSGCVDRNEGRVQGADPTAPEAEATNGTAERVLLDLNWTFTNQRPQVFAYDEHMAFVQVPANATRLNVAMACQSTPPGVFATAGRAYGPDGEFDQSAFNPGTAPCGELELSFRDPTAGEWELAYVDDQIFPAGTHRIHVRAVAWITEAREASV